nr:MAG TPA: PROTEIN P6, HIV-1, P6-GAG, AIDS, CORE [Caudoviricetes sp.]
MAQKSNIKPIISLKTVFGRDDNDLRETELD